MITPSLPAPDRRRAAQILLGFSRDDGYDRVDAVWQETYPVPARMQGLVAALAYTLLERMHEDIGEDFAPMRPARGAMFSARRRAGHSEEPTVEPVIAESEYYSG